MKTSFSIDSRKTTAFPITTRFPISANRAEIRSEERKKSYLLKDSRDK